MTPQNEVKKGFIVLIINRKQSFHLSAPVFWFYHFLPLTLSEINRINKHTMMKNNILSLCLMIALSACTSQPKPQKDSTLPILDISKEYPEIELDLNEIAEVEYVPLETTDSSVIGMGLKKIYRRNTL